jgi:hypothetical protein
VSDDDEEFQFELDIARQRSRLAVSWVVRALERKERRQRLTDEQRVRLRAYRQALSDKQE